MKYATMSMSKFVIQSMNNNVQQYTILFKNNNAAQLMNNNAQLSLSSNAALNMKKSVTQ